MENLIQQDIIRAVSNARRSGKNIKKTIRELAKEFDLPMHVVKGIVEMAATYGLEQIATEKTAGTLWKPMDHTKAIKRLEDKIYQLHAEIVRTNQRITKELRITENPWTRRGLSAFEPEEEPLEPQEHEEIPRRQILLRAREDIEPEKKNRIEELREKVDRARSRLDTREETESPCLTFQSLEKIKK